MKMYTKYHCSGFFLLEAEVHGLFRSLEAALGHDLVRFQSLQPHSTQSEGPLAPKAY
jgi:hypothetical protein